MHRDLQRGAIPGLERAEPQQHFRGPAPAGVQGVRSCTRRSFLKCGIGSAGLLALGGCEAAWGRPLAVVSIARIGRLGIPGAVREAIDLLGGIDRVTAGKQRILLKPNLVADSPRMTTKPDVVRALATMLQRAGKEVSIGEGSAAGEHFNFQDGVQYCTRNRAILDPMQRHVFDALGYADLARNLRIPLLNLHSGDLVEVPLARGFVFDRLTLHRSLVDTDLLVSVPMMKTHMLATVTLGMKNLIGLYPGTVYYSARYWLHDRAAAARSPGIAYEILDMLRANKLGLTVIDASQAMEGNGPSGGDLVDMGLIIAGTNPLATDMVGAAAMGFAPEEVPTFVTAWALGMSPRTLLDIEIRGASLDSVRRPFARPYVVPWPSEPGSWPELRDPRADRGGSAERRTPRRKPPVRAPE